MSRNFERKCVASIVRTGIAVIIITIAINLLRLALNWEQWCPNNDIGFVIVVALYAITIPSLLGGVYLLSPLYIGTFVYCMFQELIERSMPYEVERDWDPDEEMKKTIRILKDKYLW